MSDFEITRFVIVGAGAIGGSVAGLFHQANVPFAVVARGTHGETIRRDGLSLNLFDQYLSVPVHCVSTLAELDWQVGDVAVIATKLNDVPEVLVQLERFTSSSVPVVCLTNGIHAESWAAEKFETVISTLVWMPATHLKPGQVELYSGSLRGVLDSGPVKGDPDQTISNQLCQAFVLAGFEAVARQDILDWKYAKLISNLGGAAQACVSDDWHSVAEAAREEGVNVLKQAGVASVDLEVLLDRCSQVELKEIEGVSRQGGSTWQSRKRGRPLETPWIEGAIVELADQFGIEAPVNRALLKVAMNPRDVLAKEILGLGKEKSHEANAP